MAQEGIDQIGLHGSDRLCVHFASNITRELCEQFSSSWSLTPLIISFGCSMWLNIYLCI